MTERKLPGSTAAARVATIDRRMVHRASVAEVFVTGWAATSCGWLVQAQWPRSNRFHLSADASRYDALLMLETMRQAALCINLAARDLPTHPVFVLTGLDARLDPKQARVGAAPAAVAVELVLTSTGRTCQVWSARVDCDGSMVAEGTMRARVMSAAVAARMRSSVAGPPDQQPFSAVPLTPAVVGRHFDADVMIARASSGEFVLAPNRHHPVFFDHPVDHVPGLLLIEAARQMTYAQHSRLTAIDAAKADFTRYVEFGLPCEMRSRSVTCATDVTFHQAGQTCGHVRIGTP